MTSTRKELRVRISRVHHDTTASPPRHTALFEVSDFFWASAFETHHNAERVANVVRRTMCNMSCPKTANCSKVGVNVTGDIIHKYIVTADSAYDIFHKGSRATCVRLSHRPKRYSALT